MKGDFGVHPALPGTAHVKKVEKGSPNVSHMHLPSMYSSPMLLSSTYASSPLIAQLSDHMIGYSMCLRVERLCNVYGTSEASSYYKDVADLDKGLGCISGGVLVFIVLATLSALVLAISMLISHEVALRHQQYHSKHPAHNLAGGIPGIFGHPNTRIPYHFSGERRSSREWDRSCLT